MLGSDANGAPVQLDVEELLATRLLVQGNSGSGKSYLLRRLLEQSAGQVQQVVIDPEGDFVTLAEQFGHARLNDSRDVVRRAARPLRGHGRLQPLHNGAIFLSRRPPRPRRPHTRGRR